MIRLGIDVGGTNTDGVILNENNEVICSTKAATTKDVFTGIQTCIQELLAQSGIEPSSIQAAMLGTTHCTNAIVERKALNKVGIIRICLPSGSAVPPLLDWPQDLIEAIQGDMALIHGGNEYDGTPIANLDYQEIDQVLETFKGKVDSIAITGVFSPVLNEQEKHVAAYIQKIMPNIPISISSEIGSIGIIERENATILNAALKNVIKSVAGEFQHALNEADIYPSIYLGQNDGTLMTGEYAMEYPIYTIACGPTNSIRGAAYLSNEKDAIVVDIGGTTTDIGVLTSGFPRQTSIAVEVGGVRTNYRMPDIYSIGLGGGTVVHHEGSSWKIGPDSVGYQLLQKAKSFGGDELTTTDIAIAVGKMTIPGAKKIKVEQQETIYQDCVLMVEQAIDRLKTNAEDLPVVLVGGGAALMPESLKGASRVIRPEYAGVANAVGAALGEVSGNVERIFTVDNANYQDILELAKNEAIQNAIDAGADPEKIEIISLEDIPLAYMPGNAILVRVKAAAPLILKSYNALNA